MVWASTSYQASPSVGAGTSTLKTTTSVFKCASVTAACIIITCLTCRLAATTAVQVDTHHVQSSNVVGMTSAVRC